VTPGGTYNLALHTDKKYTPTHSIPNQRKRAKHLAHDILAQ
jgi:hypothetical protein